MTRPESTGSGHTELDLAITEKQFTQLVVDAARWRGWLAYHTQDSRRSAAGFPDLVLVRAGEMMFVELKTEKGRISPAQHEWLDSLARAHPAVMLWRPRDWPTIDAVLDRGHAFTLAGYPTLYRTLYPEGPPA